DEQFWMPPVDRIPRSVGLSFGVAADNPPGGGAPDEPLVKEEFRMARLTQNLQDVLPSSSGIRNKRSDDSNLMTVMEEYFPSIFITNENFVVQSKAINELPDVPLRELNVPSPQELFDKYVLSRNPATDRSANKLEMQYFDGNDFFVTPIDGANFRSHPILGKVFRVGSGDVSKTQVQGFNSVKILIKNAYKSSATFRALVRLRAKLMDLNISPSITVMVMHNGWHLWRHYNTHSSIADDRKSYIAIDGQYITPETAPGKSFFLGDDGQSVVLKPESIEHIAMHELCHVLAYTVETERTIDATLARAEQIEGTRKHAGYTVDHTDVSGMNANIKLENSAFVAISHADMPAIEDGRTIFCNTANLPGETNSLVNKILREENPEYKPILSYGEAQCYWDYRGGLVAHDLFKLQLEFQGLILGHLVSQDRRPDHRLNYPYSRLSENRKRQIIEDALNVRNHIPVKMIPGVNDAVDRRER
ncbi:hypothetical protein, partial [Enterobacter bugandensis]